MEKAKSKNSYMFVVSLFCGEFDSWGDPCENSVFITEDRKEAFEEAARHFGKCEVYVSKYDLPQKYADMPKEVLLSHIDMATFFFEDEAGDVEDFDPVEVCGEDVIRWYLNNSDCVIYGNEKQ